MQYDVTTFGELVIDLLPISAPPHLTFIAKPGGAPANVAAGVSRLGLKAAMITKVGDEVFGRAALKALAATGVATDAVIRSRSHHTALALVDRDAGGDAEYAFYRENCADANLAADEISLDTIAASRLIHFGTLPLVSPVSAHAQRRALEFAKSKGIGVSTDLNFRAALWPDREAMRQAGLEMVRSASVVKVSRDELSLLTDVSDAASAARSLWHPGLLLLAVTGGSAGAELFTDEDSVWVPAFAVTPVDTVGCGDAFTASILAGLLASKLAPPGGDALRSLAIRGCAAGAIIATRRGALESMPREAEIDEFLAAHERIRPLSQY